MAGFQGMDPVVVRGVARQMRQQAQQLDDVIAAVQQAVQHAYSLWDGEDATGFSTTWTAQHRPAIVAAHAVLVDMAATVERNADEQETASGAGSGGGTGWSGGGGGGGGGGGWGSRPSGPRDAIEPLAPVGWMSTANDVVETWSKGAWGIKDLPGGGYLGSVMGGIGLGTSAVQFVDSVQHGDLSGASVAVADIGVGVVNKSPIGLLWTGLKEEVGFYIPFDHTQQDDHLTWMREHRGLSADQVTERYTGVQGLIDLGNDNAARKAPWLVAGADKLFEKPAEWLFKAGIKL